MRILAWNTICVWNGTRKHKPSLSGLYVPAVYMKTVNICVQQNRTGLGTGQQLIGYISCHNAIWINQSTCQYTLPLHIKCHPNWCIPTPWRSGWCFSEFETGTISTTSHIGESIYICKMINHDMNLIRNVTEYVNPGQFRFCFSLFF